MANIKLIVRPPHKRKQFYLTKQLTSKASTLTLDHLNKNTQATVAQTIPKHFSTAMK